MGRRSKQTFLQRQHTDGQKAHEKMLNITNYQRNENQNYNEVEVIKKRWREYTEELYKKTSMTQITTTV